MEKIKIKDLKIDSRILEVARAKVKREKEQKEYLKTCLKARLCPMCGCELFYEVSSWNSIFSKKFNCRACSFNYELRKG